jgi:tetratricopeptide (TPR) repeat protein
MDSQHNSPATNQEMERAREVFQRAVATDPSNADAWLRLSYATPDPYQALEYVQRAVELRPNDPAIQSGLRYILFNRFKQDPFVEFLAETDRDYVITLRGSRPVVVPKRRKRSEIFPPAKSSEGQRVAGMLGWMALGILVAGAGALVLAPVVIRRAYRLLNTRGIEPIEQRRALLTLIFAAVLGLLGEAIFALFLLHWFG